MSADLQERLDRCGADDFDLLLLLQDLNDECWETDDATVWTKLELVGFVELINAGGPPPCVVLTKRGHAAVRAIRRLRDVR